MADILHDFPVRAPKERVFEVLGRPPGLDEWWTKRSSGEPLEGSDYELWFGPEHDWRAKVVRAVAGSALEWEMTRADDEWIGTRIGFELESRGETTWVRFHHSGWPSASEHFRTSSCCWAMYLRVARRFIEHGESVPYEDRLDV